MHGTHDQQGTAIPRHLDRASYEDTEALVMLLAPVSRQWQVDIGFELKGESVGWLQSGEPDVSLREGLLAA